MRSPSRHSRPPRRRSGRQPIVPSPFASDCARSRVIDAAPCSPKGRPSGPFHTVGPLLPPTAMNAAADEGLVESISAARKAVWGRLGVALALLARMPAGALCRSRTTIALPFSTRNPSDVRRPNARTSLTVIVNRALGWFCTGNLTIPVAECALQPSGRCPNHQEDLQCRGGGS